MEFRAQDIITKAIAGDRHALNKLWEEASATAEAILRLKARKHNHLFEFISPDLRNIAFDSVSELFGMRNGKLNTFSNWFERVNGNNRSDSELYIEFRRLIGSEVNDYVFRLYKSKDPSLSKLIRNIKRGVNERVIDDLQLDVNGDFIFLQSNLRNQELIQTEYLVIKLSSYAGSISNSIDALSRLREVLESFLPERKKVNLIQFAVVIRSVFIQLNEAEFEEPEEPPLLSAHEITGFIENSIHRIKQELYPTYVIKQKLSAREFDEHFYIVSQILEADYLFETGKSRFSFYEHFKSIYPIISKNEYIASYRNYLEYFVKKTREQLISELKKELDSVAILNGKGN